MNVSSISIQSFPFHSSSSSIPFNSFHSIHRQAIPARFLLFSKSLGRSIQVHSFQEAEVSRKIDPSLFAVTDTNLPGYPGPHPPGCDCLWLIQANGADHLGPGVRFDWTAAGLGAGDTFSTFDGTTVSDKQTKT